MNLSISNIAWLPEDNSEMFKLMHKYGFTGLEVAPGLLFPNSDEPYSLSDNDIKQKRIEINNAGFEIISLQSLLFGSKDLYLFHNSESRDHLLMYLFKAVRFASLLGIKNLVFGSPKNRLIPKDMTVEEANEIALDFFYKLGEEALRNNTCIGLEANAKEYGCNFLYETVNTTRFIKNVNSKGIMLNLDMSTMSLNNEESTVIVNVADEINHIHISEPYLDTVPMSLDVHSERSTVIKEIQYEKYISIEMRKPMSAEYLNLVEESMLFVRDVYS